MGWISSSAGAPRVEGPDESEGLVTGYDMSPWAFHHGSHTFSTGRAGVCCNRKTFSTNKQQTKGLELLELLEFMGTYWNYFTQTYIVHGFHAKGLELLESGTNTSTCWFTHWEKQQALLSSRATPPRRSLAGAGVRGRGKPHSIHGWEGMYAVHVYIYIIIHICTLYMYIHMYCIVSFWTLYSSCSFQDKASTINRRWMSRCE